VTDHVLGCSDSVTGVKKSWSACIVDSRKFMNCSYTTCESHWLWIFSYSSMQWDQGVRVLESWQS